MFESLYPLPRFTDSFSRMPRSSAVKPTVSRNITQEAEHDDEGPFELADEHGEESIPEGKGLAEEYEHHDEDKGSDDHLDGLDRGRLTRK